MKESMHSVKTLDRAKIRRIAIEIIDERLKRNLKMPISCRTVARRAAREYYNLRSNDPLPIRGQMITIFYNTVRDTLIEKGLEPDKELSATGRTRGGLVYVLGFD